MVRDGMEEVIRINFIAVLNVRNNLKIKDMEHRIEELINNNKKLVDRIHDRISVELQKQKDNGKKFISDDEIDKLIDEALKDECYNKK